MERGKEINRTEAGDGEGEDGEDGDEMVAAKGKGKAAAGGARQIVTVAIKWVQDILDLKDRFDTILLKSFRDDKQVQTSLNEAFESVINLNPRSPEYISLFIDENLKKGLKGKTDDEVDIILDKTITVFRFVTEKDVFERYYKSHLAKRLLQGRSVSDDAERGMLAKLKVECGFQFTQKLEGMFHDMKISTETNAAYREHLVRNERKEIDLAVQVLTSTFWPMSNAQVTCQLPPEMANACQAFERFYLTRHTGRRLSWQHTLGNADVRVTFKARKHDLNVATFALVVLLLFEEMEDGDQLSYQDIKATTSISDAELKRHLQSLACAKFKILKKHPPGRDVLESDSFSFNHDFTAPLQRIKIGTIASKAENTDERRETREKVDEERKHQTDACIVRVMKDRKHMGHNDLINEVTRQLASRFQPMPTQIKKRIEALIEREYLERGKDKKSYNYLA
jgi:cullin 3